jgi:hypothetical protein
MSNGVPLRSTDLGDSQPFIGKPLPARKDFSELALSRPWRKWPVAMAEMNQCADIYSLLFLAAWGI